MSKLTVYKASAGSGKTYRLVAEYIKLLIDKPQAYREILAVTFTNKATAEMKRRIAQNLFEIKSGRETDLLNTLSAETGKDKEYIRRQATAALSYILHDYSMFSISTIDSFVQRIVQNLLWEMGQHGNNNLVIDETPYIQKAADMLLDNLTLHPELLEHVKRTMEEKLNENESPRIQEDLVNLGSMLFLEDYKMLSEAERNFMHNKNNLKKLKDKVQEIIVKIHEEITRKSAEVLQLAEQGGYYDSGKKDTYKNFFRQREGIFPFILKLSEVKCGSMVEMNKYADKALRDITTWITKDTANKQKNLVNFVEKTLMPAYEELYNYINPNLLLYNTAIAINKNLPTLYVINELHTTLREKLKDDGVMLLSDSSTLLKEFVTQTDTPFIYEKIGTRYSSYMLDEFQDTSQLQWRNFEPLISDSLGSGGFSMVVGDVKQSIYRWRNSDWRIMANIENHPQFQTEVKSLSVNRRSAKTVVEFNNHFFNNLVNWLKDEVNSSESETISSLEFENLYSDIQQEWLKSEIEGYVEVSFLPLKEKDQKKDALRDYIKNILIDLKRRGYKPGDIAFLVRKNKQGAEIAEMLLGIKHTVSELADYINIVSQEALTLNSSAAVRFCISALRIALNPNDSMAKAQFQKELATLRDTNIQWADIFNADYTSDFEWLKSIMYYPLGNMIESVIERFYLNKQKQNLPYLSMLHEEAIRFSYRGTSSLSRFLEWYDEEGRNQKLFMAKVENAINILSVHKSKGLEFPVVIFPDADLLNQRNPYDGIKWFKLPQTVYDKQTNEFPWNYPLYPVKLNKDLLNTLFRENYLNEQLYKKIDDINLQYVAFTRAERELYIIVFDKELAKEGSAESELEKVVAQNKFAGFLPNLNSFSKAFTENTVIYSYGEKKSKEEKQALNKTEQRSITGYPIHEKKNSIARQFNYLRAGAKTKEGLLHGIAMHAILSKIFTVSDIPLAIDWAVQNGFIAPNQRSTISQKIESMLSLEPFSRWFTDSWKVKAEMAVIDVGGKTYRPDRVLLSDNEVLIIDFKFGLPLEKHRSQVVEYVKLIKNMGYPNVRGYLWYPELNRTDEVAV